MPAQHIQANTTDPGYGNIVTNSNVLIGGETVPAAQLHIVGDGLFTGNITAYYSSDISLKDNIRPIESAIFKVQQIRGVTFDWNEKAGKIEQQKGHDVGLIAQEVEKVLPEVVQIREDGIKAISYEKVVPLLVEAVKDQQVIIENLENRIKLLEDK
jgi:chaperonin cofactor prefoldin